MISAQLFVKGNKVSSQSFSADNSLISVDSTIQTTDATGVMIYTEEFQKVTLFNDENISITSTIQNISDISKVYTDFSQSFTVPADDINNALFLHWYNNFIDDGFDARLRIDAIIYVDTKVFRIGLIQLDKASIIDSKPQNYTLTFFGKLVSLKDKIKEDKLNSLTYINDAYAPFYSSTDVINDVKNNVQKDVMFPLISSKRTWSYGNNFPTDIKTTNGAIFFNELFPALKVVNIFKAIEETYNIKFVSTFFSDPKFTKLYMHLKNREQFLFISKETQLTFSYIVGENDSPYFFPNLIGYVYYDGRLAGDTAFLNIIILQTIGIFRINVYKDSDLFISFNGVGKTVQQGFQIFNDGGLNGNPNYIGTYTFTISSSEPNAMFVQGYSEKFSTGQSGQFSAQIATPSVGLMDLLQYMPDMKITDFISGILKMFNLTIFSYDENIFNVETLEDFYASGIKRDLTDFIEDKNDIDRVKAYSKIVFKYAKSESYMNVLFYQNNNLEWGELQNKFDFDGSEYKIDIPFENILHNHFDNTDIQVSYYLKTDYITSIVPKAPVLLYYFGNKTLLTNKFKMKDNLNVATELSTYNAFGQDIFTNGTSYSLNFGYENSSFFNIPIENGLYKTYYENYLLNIFNQKARNVKITALLPASMILNLRLNDRIIIAQKAYIINTFTTDLMTGIVTLDLISDFRIAT